MAEGEHGSAPHVHTIPTLLGRARCASGTYAVHVFGAVNTATDGTASSFTTFPARRGINRTDCQSRTGWLRAVIAGKEVQRSGQALAPLTDLSYFSGPPVDRPTPPAFPAGTVASMSGRSQLKASIGINDGTSERWLSFDMGQSIDFIAECASAVFHAPAGFVDVATSPGATSTGLVIDAYISVHFWEIEAPLQRRGHFTDHLFVPAGTTRSLRVPDGAREVQIRQSLLGDAATVFTEWSGDPVILAAATQVGSLAFEAGQRQTPRKFVGDATHILSDSDSDTDRFFSVIWQIEP